jgi:hypothetical protein
VNPNLSVVFSKDPVTGGTLIAHDNFPPRPRVDATTHFDLPVSDLDRRDGVSGSFTHCANALAWKRQPGVIWVVFMKSMVYVGYEDRVVVYETSTEAQTEIIRNDVPALGKHLPPPPKTIRLHPVRASKTMAGKKATIAKHAAAVKAGTAGTTAKSPGMTRKAPTYIAGVRSGMGTTAGSQS